MLMAAQDLGLGIDVLGIHVISPAARFQLLLVQERWQMASPKSKQHAAA